MTIEVLLRFPIPKEKSDIPHLDLMHVRFWRKKGEVIFEFWPKAQIEIGRNLTHDDYP